jgi:hypothetical protein
MFAQSDDNYFQQQLEYDIKAKLNDVTHTVSGNIQIKYTNRSKSSLDTLWFHLWPNAYADRSTPLCKQLVTDRNTSLFFADDKDRGAIDSVSFQVDDRDVQMVYVPNSKEIVALILNKPIEPNAFAIITTPFSVKIPDAKFSRMGREGDAYYVTQWYPKPAVFDKDGWHPMPYLSRGEFYAEFGSFKVELEIASDYIVAASGQLLDENENDFLRSINRKMITHTGISDSTKRTTTTKKLRFTLDHAHDFAWFADRNFHVLLDTVYLESGKSIATAVYHTSKKSELWQEAPSYAKSGLEFLSKTIGDYPYETFTVVDGRISAGGGMEYPSITILNSPSTAEDLERVLVHELGHNWFYGALASNERTDPWMDEGMNSYYEQLYMHNARVSTSFQQNGISQFLGKLLGFSDLGQDSLTDIILHLTSFDHEDQPIKTHSEKFTAFNYGVIAYLKTAKAFEFLFDYLGPERSEACIKNYYAQWKFRHPSPIDLQKSFEESSGENLNWFFQDWLNTNYPMRLHIRGNKDQKNLSIKRISGPQTPLYLSNKSGNYEWIETFASDTTINISNLSTPISINDQYFRLLKGQDMIINGSYKKSTKPIRIRMFPVLSNGYNVRNLTLMPIAGWNSYDQIMAGLYLSNRNFVPQKTEFSITPMYSLNRSEIAGAASLTQNFWPLKGIISHWQATLSGASYGYDVYENTTSNFSALKKTLDFKKTEARIKLKFRNNDPLSRIENALTIRAVGLFTEEAVFDLNVPGNPRSFRHVPKYFNLISFDRSNTRKIDPYQFSVTMNGSDDHLKISTEIKYRISYKKDRKGFDARLFVGAFVHNETVRNYNFKMSSWGGSDDYMFDGMYLGRNESSGLWSRQMLIRDGGFINPMALGQSGKWLAAIHLSTDNPTPLPIRAFLNVGTYEGINSIFEDLQNKFMYEGGLSLAIAKDIIEIHVPLFQSEDIQRTLETNNITFAERIRFVLDLNKVSFDQLRTMIINSIR